MTGEEAALLYQTERAASVARRLARGVFNESRDVLRPFPRPTTKLPRYVRKRVMSSIEERVSRREEQQRYKQRQRWRESKQRQRDRGKG